jgi:hypothetical protein
MRIIRFPHGLGREYSLAVVEGANGSTRSRLCDNSPALKVYGGTEESLRPGFEGKKAESITPSRS